MSFKTALTKLTKANAIDVSSNHVAYIQLVMDNCAKALQSVKSEADAATNVTTLTALIEASFPVDLLDTWMAECEALIKHQKKGPATTPPTTSTASTSVPPSTPDSDDEATGPRRLPTYKLPPNIPMFMAEGRTCEEWFFVFENALRTNSIPYAVTLSILSTFLKGTALHLLKNYMDSGKTDWNDFKDLLRTTFLPKDHEYRLRVQLTKLTQNNDSIDTFNRKFLAISTQLNGLTDTDRLFHYTSGLHDRTRYEVLSKQPKTLDEALAIATQFNHINNHAPVADINATTVRFQKTDSRRVQSPRFKSQQSKPKPQVTCYKCNRQGHYSNDCRSSASSAPKGSVDRASNGRASIKPRQPYKQALTFTRSDIDTLLKVEGSILSQGKSPALLLCTLDSAASVSMISEVTARHYGFVILPSDIRIKSANNAVTAVVGTTDLVTVDIQGHSCQLTLVVLDHDDHEVLLGLDWFMATGASLHPKSHTLQFPGTVVHLHSPQQSDDNGTDEDDNCILSVSLADEDDIAVDVDWHTTAPIKMKPLGSLTTSQTASFATLAQTAQSSFATDYDSLGCCNISKHEIRLQTRVPIYSHPYRKSLRERDMLNVEITKLLQAKIIRKSRSPYASPVILVPKKDGSIRMCVDYRRLNLETLPEQWPLPRIADILDNMLGSLWFSTLDLKSGYYQVAMSPASVEKTAFVTPDGHYEFLRLPFGLKNAPSHFSKIMFQALGDLNFVKIYLDDITIHSKSFDLHLEHVSTVLERLRQANLKLNGDKCTWFAQEVALLGHIVNTSGIHMDPKKIQAIQAMLPPTNVKQVQQFLGICNYYRKFIAEFAKISQPIAELVRKEIPFVWSTACNEAFVRLKSMLLEFPILRQPDHSKPFYIYTDASGYALGAILSQFDDNSNEYVCQYASRLLKGAEIHYGITEKECLAVIWAIRQFRTYVHGVHFHVITDHNALVWLMSIRDPSGKLARWAIYLQSYDYEIKHRKGRVHSNVDTLSRPVLTLSVSSPSSTVALSVTNTDPLEDEALLHFLKFGRHLAGTSERKCKHVSTKLPYFKYENNTLWYRRKVDNSQYLEVPLRSTRYDIVLNEHLLGHFQASTVYNSIKTKYYWPKMQQDITHIIGQCNNCNRHRQVPVKDHPAQPINPTSVFNMCGMDLIFGLPPTAEGYTGIVVITEYVTKFPYAVPIKTKNSQEIAEKLFEYVSLFGPPKNWVSDQGREFMGMCTHFSKIIGTEHRVTAAYNPRTNGLTERFNRTLCDALRKHAEADPLQWHKWLPYVLMSYRRRIHTITKYSPFQLMFGRSMNHFGDWKNDEQCDTVSNLFTRSMELQQLLQLFQPAAIANIVGHHPAQIKAQESQHTIVTTVLTPGTTVFLKIEGLLGKLEPRFRGPYTIHSQLKNGNYKIKNVLGTVLKTVYPLHKFKVVVPQDDDTPHQEVEKILTHRYNNEEKSYEYFVKWKDFDEDENSWEPESSFDTLDIINKYWKAVHATKPVNVLRMIKFTPLAMILWLFMLICCCSPADTFLMINDSLPYCDNSKTPTLVDMEQSCVHSRDETAKSALYIRINTSSRKTYGSSYLNSTKYHVVTKKANKVHGVGWQCQITKLFTIYYKTFLRDEVIENEWVESIKMSPAECLMMVQF